MSTASTSIRLNTENRDKANEVYAKLGTNLSSVVNMLNAQVALHGRIPFELDTQPRYSAGTLAAAAELEAYIRGEVDLPKYATPKDMWRALDADEL
ncbi:MAG: type II toxin-antitoxin system RelB/DinJ family antitoxin [Coriobacteriia bacterium]|nr:type II toxin-antitoxin system RelB/DinJ family antitoxin [Coriobacteriia bacterium]MCL2537065.1 type II toxin-antitoxin system RelB/DinJ family antitoxin [Coriobacteriia bacterium]